MPTNASVGVSIGSIGSDGATFADLAVDLVPLTLSNDTVPESTAINGLVGHITGFDPGSTLTLTNDAGGKFSISGTDIVVTGALNYEAATSHLIEIKESNPHATNNDNLTQWTVQITNVLEVTLVALTLSANSISENAANATVIGAIQNIHAGSSITLVDNAGGKFALSGSNLVKNGALDYETAASHNVTIQEDHPDGTNSGRQTTLAVNITNVLEVTLAALTLSAASVAEDAANGTVIGAINGKSAGSTLSLADDAGGKFEIISGNLVKKAALDYETAASHNVTIQEDHPDATNSGRQTIKTVTVLDVFEADPHRYWRFAPTAAMNGGAGVCIWQIAMAERIGGAHALGAVVPTVTSTSSGAIANAVNGLPNDGTYWFGASNITWDLGATSANWKDIRQCRINTRWDWHPQGPKTFKIQYSDDGVSWFDRITVASETSWDGSQLNDMRPRIFDATVQPVAAAGFLLYRINISAGVDASQCAIGEIEWRETVGGADLSFPNAGWFVTANSGNAWTSTFDNNTASGGWFGTSGFPYRGGVQLAESKVLGEVSIMPFPGFAAYAPKDFTIEGSNDYTNWTVVKTPASQTGWANAPTARTFAIP